MQDQPASLPLLGRGHVDDGELIEQRQLGELQGVVAIGLAFDAAPLPGLAVGRHDLR